MAAVSPSISSGDRSDTVVYCDGRFQQLFSSTEQSEVALRIRYEEACREGTVEAMLDGKLHPHDMRADASGEARPAGAGQSALVEDAEGGKSEPTLAEKLKARARLQSGPLHGSHSLADGNGVASRGASGGLGDGVARTADPAAKEEADEGAGLDQEGGQHTRCGERSNDAGQGQRCWERPPSMDEGDGSLTKDCNNKGTMGGKGSHFALSENARLDLGFALSSPPREKMVETASRRDSKGVAGIESVREEHEAAS
jgi:hypothetical protein